MRLAKTTRRVREVEGYIDPHGRYTTDGCMSKCGIGEEMLHEGRKAGILKPIEPGRYTYYRGNELIELVEWKAEKRKRRTA